MRSFYPKSAVESGLLLNLLLLFLFGGGSEPAGFALYEVLTLCTFLAAFPDSFPKTPLGRFIAAFMLILGVSTLLSLAAGTQGIAEFSLIACHCLNFYVFWKIADSAFISRVFALILAMNVWMSLEIIIGEVLGYLVLEPGQMSWRPINIYQTSFPNSNLDSGFMAMGILVLLSNLFLGDKGKVKLAGIVLLILLASANFLTLSRGAILSLAAGGMVIVLTDWKKALRLLGYMMIFTLLVLNLSERIMQSFAFKIESKGSMMRIVVWKGALNAVKEKPILGWGPGGFERAYRLHRLPFENEMGRFEMVTRFAHNEFLHLTVEGGGAGLLAWLCLVFIVLRKGFIGVRNNRLEWQRLAAFAALCSMLVHSLIDYNLHLPIFGFLSAAFAAFTLKDPEMVSASCGPRLFQKARPWVKGILWGWMSVLIFALISQGMLRVSEFRIKRNDFAQAERWARNALRLNPFSGIALMELINISVTDESVRQIERVLPFHRENDRVYAYLARTSLLKNEYEKSIRNYQEAIKKNPKQPFYLTELAEILLRMKQFQAALALYQNAARMEPLYLLAHYRIGEIYILQGKKAEAMTAFENVKKIQNARLRPSSQYTSRLLDLKPGINEARIAMLKK